MTRQQNFPLRDGGIIYNVTASVDSSFASEWLHWLLNEHAPEVISTACFTNYGVLKLLHLEDGEDITYAVQYYAESIEQYERYTSEFASVLRQKSVNRWGERVITYRTVMEVIR